MKDMFSKTCEYSIRSAIYIASLHRKGRRVGVQEIADEIGSPAAFTAKILQRLVKLDILKSVKGPRGGFCLARPAEELYILDFVVAIDGENVLQDCILGFKKCSSKKPCPLHDKFVEVREHLNKLLRKTTLAQAEKTYSTGDTVLKLINEI